MIDQTVDIVSVFTSVLCTFFTLYQFVLIASILITWVNPDPNNPFVHWLNRVTHPLWNWVGQWIPLKLQPFRAYCALLFVFFLHAFVPATIQSLNIFAQNPEDGQALFTQVFGHGLQGLGYVSDSVIWFAIFILAIWLVMTLISPSWNNPIVQAVYMLADPLVTPIQRYLPRTKIDLSPVVGIALLYLLSHFVINRVIGIGADFSSPIGICL